MQYKNANSKKILLAIILYLFWVGYFTVNNYIEEKNRIYKEIDTKLISGAKILPLLLSSNFHKKEMNKDTVSKEEDWRNIILISKVADVMGLKYIYSLILKDGKIYFSSSSGTAEERKTHHNLATYFTHYDDVPPEVKMAFDTGKIQFAEYSDKWGDFRSVFIPMLTKGKVTYLVAADIETSYVKSLLKDSLFKSLMNSLWFVMFLVPFIIFYFRELWYSKKALESKVEKRTKELNKTNEKLKKLASTDPLTELFNRRHFESLTEPFLELAKRNDTEIAIIVIDIDNFKKINDTYGHKVGDDVIVDLATILKRGSRQSDIVCRWGGEEFIILLANTNGKSVLTIAEKIRKKVENLVRTLEDGNELKFTISCGVALVNKESNTSIHNVIDRADRALYKAKNSGKNKVVEST
ncbi:GGDEF domain-containing protein [Sulfurovum sp. NBC37-1]|uniref:GGDEF domain-containing protein n=1 Tax=Sulfurovum sp. (strain NBC37-1) TaxID=387093 RepID=UPI00015875C6|nr:GGDEF domain-containing protein [Sulfurovum sp. NBC37-1]BAF72160.1 signal transduction response regulator [Sulfurovum sp. NBC37-1]